MIQIYSRKNLLSSHQKEKHVKIETLLIAEKIVIKKIAGLTGHVDEETLKKKIEGDKKKKTRDNNKDVSIVKKRRDDYAKKTKKIDNENSNVNEDAVFDNKNTRRDFDEKKRKIVKNRRDFEREELTKRNAE